MDDKDLNYVEPEPVNDPDAKPIPPPSSSKFFGMLRNVQRYSSYGFVGFLGMHAASVIITPAISVEAGNETLNFTKAVYQEALLEPFLVYIPLTLHIASGVILRVHKNYLHKKHYGHWPSLRKVWKSMSSVAKSGVILTPLILVHISSMRIAPLNVLGDSASISLEYMAHWIHSKPLLMWTGYPIIICGTMFHVVMGFRKWFGIHTKRSLKYGLGIVGGLSLMGLVSFFRISRMPEVTGWVLKQYSRVLATF